MEWVFDTINVSVISSILYIHFCNFGFVFESIPPKRTNKVVVVVVPVVVIVNFIQFEKQTHPSLLQTHYFRCSAAHSESYSSYW